MQDRDAYDPSERMSASRASMLLLWMMAAMLTIAPLLQKLSRGFGSIASFVLIFGALPLMFLGKRLFKQVRPDQARGRFVCLGALAGLLNYGIALALQVIPLSVFELAAPDPATLFQGEPLAERIALAFAICLAAPLFEEFAFRGALQPHFAQRFTPRWGIFITAVAYAVIHLDVAGLVARIEMGLVFGLLAYWSGSIVPSVAAHAVHNAVGLTSLFLQQFMIGSSEPVPENVINGEFYLWTFASLTLTGCILHLFRKSASYAPRLSDPIGPEAKNIEKHVPPP